ncbi:MAG: DUF1840 domain-containing protein [Motiliproteus sp.]|nr:DUF1840 domain-containing protein [Motiliproteus sp.]MCW9053007.1 DUF1840 domain-containing protein [Motiliproteus sp.]
MLITFKTDYYANITMFGDIAKTLIKMMGHSDSTPGAILNDDLPAALANLKAALSHLNPVNDQDNDDDNEPAVGLEKRAVPVIELMENAIKNGCDVVWE